MENRRQHFILVPRSLKPCCEQAEIKLKILSRAIRRKSSIEQLTHLLDCLVDTKNGHSEMLSFGHHARERKLRHLREQVKGDEPRKYHMKPKVKKEKTEKPNSGNDNSQWSRRPPALEVPSPESLPLQSNPSNLAQKSVPVSEGSATKTTVNGHWESCESIPRVKKEVTLGVDVAKVAETGQKNKRSAAHWSKTPRSKKKVRLENGGEESKSIKIKRPSVYVFCQHCKKIRHLAPRSDKKSKKDVFRHDCRNAAGQAIRVSQNFVTRNRNCTLDHEAGCIRLATTKEISDLQKKKREGGVKKELGVVPNIKKELGTLSLLRRELDDLLGINKELGALPV